MTDLVSGLDPPDASPVPPPSSASRRDRRPSGWRRGRGSGDGEGRRHGNGRKIAVVLVLLVALLLTPIAIAGGWYWFQVHPSGDPGATVSVTIEDGWGVGRIGDELETKGVIGSALAFRIYARMHDAPIGIGTYDLRKNMGIASFYSALASGPSAVPQVGVLPGLRLDEVGDRVAAIKRFSKATFLQLATGGTIRSTFEPAGVNTLEGLIRPDSYRVPGDQTESGLTTEMVHAFDENAAKLGLTAAAAKLGVTPYEVVTVASLVQREAKLDEDRTLIAAVIYNRLRKGMELQIDATTQYADATGDPAYDTYKIHGLPPTPISTVSASSLGAAMHPADVPYLYYVLSDADGKHAFATTYDQHLKNVAAARAKGLVK